MDDRILSRLSKFIWGIGLVALIYQALPDLWGTVKFIFSFLGGLFSGDGPDATETEHASATFSVLFALFVMCLFAQLVVLATPFITTGSKALIDLYTKREAQALKAVKGQIDLAKQINEACSELQQYRQDIQQCRALLNHLHEEMRALTEAVSLSRKSLKSQITETNKLNSKGDF